MKSMYPKKISYGIVSAMVDYSEQKESDRITAIKDIHAGNVKLGIKSKALPLKVFDSKAEKELYPIILQDYLGALREKKDKEGNIENAIDTAKANKCLLNAMLILSASEKDINTVLLKASVIHSLLKEKVSKTSMVLTEEGKALRDSYDEKIKKAIEDKSLSDSKKDEIIKELRKEKSVNLSTTKGMYQPLEINSNSVANFRKEFEIVIASTLLSTNIVKAHESTQLEKSKEKLLKAFDNKLKDVEKFGYPMEKYNKYKAKLDIEGLRADYKKWKASQKAKLQKAK